VGFICIGFYTKKNSRKNAKDYRKKKIVESTREILRLRLQYADMRNIFSISDTQEDELDESLVDLFKLVSSERYFYPRILHTRQGDMTHFLNKSDTDFKLLFRVSKS
jgi:hypothetical protein